MSNDYQVVYRESLFSILCILFCFVTNTNTVISVCRDLLDKQALFSWWHGKGGLLDYSNPEALQWWHQQMDKVSLRRMESVCVSQSLFSTAYTTQSCAL